MKEEYDNYGDLITDAMAEMTEKMISCADQIHLKSYHSAYERGLNDAWECAKRIYNDNSFFVNEEIFGKGRSHFGKITDDYSASEAIAKIKEYEKKHNAIANTDEEIIKDNLEELSKSGFSLHNIALVLKKMLKEQRKEDNCEVKE